MGVINKQEILKAFWKALRSGWIITKEHRDYILIKELYHCSPSELEQQEEAMLDLHYSMLMEERKQEHIERERAKQKAEQKRLLKR